MFYFNATIDFFEKLYKEILNDSETRENFNLNIEMARQVHENSLENFNKFFNIVMGIEINPKFSMNTMCFPKRFLNKHDVNELNLEEKTILENIIHGCFYIGFIHHFIHTSFPTRENISNVDFKILFEQWILETLISSVQLKGEYNKDTNSELIFKHYYEINHVEEKFKTKFKIGFLKRSRILPFMKNIFYSGALYGLKYDLATKDL